MSTLQVTNIHLNTGATSRIQESSGNITFTTNNTEDGRFDLAGNLLIGRTDSTVGARVKLDVNGAVNASSIIVTGAANASSIAVASGNLLVGRTDSTVGLGVKVDVNGSINVAALYVNGAPLQSGATIYDDTINATRYVTFVDAISGTMLRANVDTALSFNPSTGTLSSTLFNSTSDINKKDNIVQVTDALNILYQIDGVRFTWKDNGLPSLGVIAQQVEKVLPEIVESEKSVNYNGLIAVLIEAVKELKAEIEELKKSKW